MGARRLLEGLSVTLARRPAELQRWFRPGRSSRAPRSSPIRSTSTGCCCRRSRPSARGATCASCWCGRVSGSPVFFPSSAWRATRACRCPRSNPGCTRIACFARRSCAPTRRAPAWKRFRLPGCPAGRGQLPAGGRAVPPRTRRGARRPRRAELRQPQPQPRPAAQAPRHRLRPVPPASGEQRAAAQGSVAGHAAAAGRCRALDRQLPAHRGKRLEGTQRQREGVHGEEPALRSRDPRRGVSPRAAASAAGSTSTAGRSRGASATPRARPPRRSRPPTTRRYADASRPAPCSSSANVRQVDADPRLRWMDSFTEDEKPGARAPWPERRQRGISAAPAGAPAPAGKRGRRGAVRLIAPIKRPAHPVK